MDNERVLVIGGGSIGARHLNNLQKLRVEKLALVEPDNSRLKDLNEKEFIDGFETLDEGLEWNPNIAIVSSPTHLHISHALKVVRSDCHLFIEKPLSAVRSGLIELAEEVTRKKLVTLVGCNMRFHPGPAKVKQLLEREVLGKILFARVYTGSYLPEWRPQQDYRKNYSANNSMGGGCLLDCIHEIDLTRWYLGEIEQVFCRAGHLSSLEIDVEDVATLSCQHTNGALSEIHLDYVQRTYERGCQIVGERGSIFWDYTEETVRWFDAEVNSWKTFTQSEGWQTNQMYLDEMKHFLECIHEGKQTTLPVSEALEVMRVVFAAKASNQSGCSINKEEIRLW